MSRRKYKHHYFVYSDDECYGNTRYWAVTGRSESNIAYAKTKAMALRWVRRFFRAGCKKVTIVGRHFRRSRKYPNGYKSTEIWFADKSEFGTGHPRINDICAELAAKTETEGGGE